jgi:hypothetical protein
LFLVHVAPTGVLDVELLPVQIDNMQVNAAQGLPREVFVRQFATLCAEMGTEVVAGPYADTLAIQALARSGR